MKTRKFKYRLGGRGVGKQNKMRKLFVDLDEEGEREKLITPFTAVKDTGNRTKFETGSEKDLGSGRGRYDLIPLNTLAKQLKDIDESWFIGNIGKSLTMPQVYDKIESLEFALHIFVEEILDKTIWEVMPDVALLYEKGAKKYSDRDWEKGRPHEVYVNSILRHFTQYKCGETDEDHAAAVVWNLISLIDTLRRLPSLAYTAPLYEDDNVNDIIYGKKDKMLKTE